MAKLEILQADYKTLSRTVIQTNVNAGLLFKEAVCGNGGEGIGNEIVEKTMFGMVFSQTW